MKTTKYGSLKSNLISYTFIAPALFGFLAFLLYPIIAAISMSFMDWNLMRPPTWAGLSNYTHLFRDTVFLTSLKNTIKWVVFYVPISVISSFMFALILEQSLKGSTFFRTVFYLPVVSPLLVIAMMFVWLYNTEFGLINYVLSMVGIKNIGWLTNPKMAIYSIALMAVWKNAGWNMLIFLAALKGIPRSMYEAADIDGASPLRKLWSIKLPLITHALYFIIVMSIIWAFQVFGEIYIMTKGGPGYATYTMTFYLWSNAFEYSSFSYACTIGVFMFAVIFIITMIQNKFFGARVQYDM